jgi:hypothetical protein
LNATADYNYEDQKYTGKFLIKGDPKPEYFDNSNILLENERIVNCEW